MNLAGCQIQNTYLRDKQDGLLKPEAILLVSFQKNLHSVKPFLSKIASASWTPAQ